MVRVLYHPYLSSLPCLRSDSSFDSVIQECQIHFHVPPPETLLVFQTASCSLTRNPTSPKICSPTFSFWSPPFPQSLCPTEAVLHWSLRRMKRPFLSLSRLVFIKLGSPPAPPLFTFVSSPSRMSSRRFQVAREHAPLSLSFSARCLFDTPNPSVSGGSTALLGIPYPQFFSPFSFPSPSFPRMKKSP